MSACRRVSGNSRSVDAGRLLDCLSESGLRIGECRCYFVAVGEIHKLFGFRDSHYALYGRDSDGFSREKYEDEMIDAVRKSSLMCVAYVSFLVFVTIPLAPGLCDIVTNLVNPSEVWHKTEWPRLDELSRTLKEPLIIFVFYEIVFRIRLAKLKKALKNEE